MGIIETIKMLAEEEGVKKGLEIGMKKGSHNEKIIFVKSLLQNTDFNNSKIAKLCNVSEEVVIQIKRELDI